MWTCSGREVSSASLWMFSKYVNRPIIMLLTSATYLKYGSRYHWNNKNMHTVPYTDSMGMVVTKGKHKVGTSKY